MLSLLILSEELQLHAIAFVCYSTANRVGAFPRQRIAGHASPCQSNSLLCHL